MRSLDLARIRDLLKVAAESGAAEVEIEERGVRIVVRRDVSAVMVQPSLMMAPNAGIPAPAPVVAMPADPSPPPREEEPEEGVFVHAPTPGTFYAAPSPDTDNFVSVGDRVEPGDALCIIEAMKIMNEIESEVAGTILKILAKDAEPVEYDQRLFLIEPA